jgi:hypothetical protein
MNLKESKINLTSVSKALFYHVRIDKSLSGRGRRWGRPHKAKMVSFYQTRETGSADSINGGKEKQISDSPTVHW